MQEIAYSVRGFLTVRGSSLRVALRGSLALRVDRDSGLFTGDLVLDESAVSRAVLGVGLLQANVQITPKSPVIGGFDHEGGILAAVTVEAVITAARAAGRALLSGRSCRTATEAVVPLRSRPGFDLERGGRLAGRYHRPPFTGCGWITPVVNLVVAGPGNVVVIDLSPVTS
jgi:hypothetical protein